MILNGRKTVRRYQKDQLSPVVVEFEEGDFAWGDGSPIDKKQLKSLKKWMPLEAIERLTKWLEAQEAAKKLISEPLAIEETENVNQEMSEVP